MITQQAMKAGFTGGLVVDYPNSTRAKKWVIIRAVERSWSSVLKRMFLCLFAGGQVQQLPQGLTGEEGSEERRTQARFDQERYGIDFWSVDRLNFLFRNLFLDNATEICVVNRWRRVEHGF